MENTAQNGHFVRTILGANTENALYIFQNIILNEISDFTKKSLAQQIEYKSVFWSSAPRAGPKKTFLFNLLSW